MNANHGVTEYPNTFKRQGDFPLDKTSIFNSYEDAANYAATSPIAYGGQIIGVKNTSNDNYTAYILQPSKDVGHNYTLEAMQAYNFESPDEEIIFDCGTALNYDNLNIDDNT